MRSVVSLEEELQYKPIPKEIVESLEERQGNKSVIFRYVPFLRVSCLQQVDFSENGRDSQKSNNVNSSKLGVSKSIINGFTFTSNVSNNNFQVVGRDITDGEFISINNPRRVPSPQLKSFTANYGGTGGLFGKATLTFTAHSLEQLEFLNPFLLRPGNSIVIEFGHSSPETNNADIFFDKEDMKNYINSVGADITSNNSNDIFESSFFKAMEDRVLKTKGNYEYFAGQVTDFNFSMNDQLGFDCTVNLFAISKIAVDSTVPLSTNSDEDVAIIEKVRKNSLDVYLDRAIEQINPDSFLGSDIIKLSDAYGGENGEYYITLQWAINFLNNPWGQPYFGNDAKLSINSRVRNNPYIISNTKDVIFFKKQMPFLTNFNFNKKEQKKYVDYSSNNAFSFTDISSSEIASSAVYKESVSNTFFSKNRNLFDSFIPLFFDDSTDANLGNLNYVYIRAEYFKRLISNGNATTYQIFKDILRKVNKSVNNIWDLDIIDTTVGVSNETSVIDYSTLPLDNSLNTYEFKLNSRDSIVESVQFELGLSQLAGQSVYFNSLGAISNSHDSYNVSLLLFDKWENNLKVKDFINEIRTNAYKDLSKSGDSLDIIGISLENIKSNAPSPLATTASGQSISDMFFSPSDTLEHFIINRFDDVTLATELEKVRLIDSDNYPYYLAMHKKGYFDTNNASPILSPTMEFSMPGMGGISPLRYINISGLPDVYSNRGSFVIRDVVHAVTADSWKTTIKSSFRINNE